MSTDSALTFTRGSPIITKTPIAHLALALWSAACSCVALLVIFLLAASAPAGEPSAHNAAEATTQASALDAAKKQPASSMLEASGYAIAKDKLD